MRLAPEPVETLTRAAEALGKITVDLEQRQVRPAGEAFAFEIGELQKGMMLAGLDEIGLMQTRAEAQARFNARDAVLRPWVRERPAS